MKSKYLYLGSVEYTTKRMDTPASVARSDCDASRSTKLVTMPRFDAKARVRRRRYSRSEATRSKPKGACTYDVCSGRAVPQKQK